MFISPAYAQDAAAGGAGAIVMQLLPLLLISQAIPVFAIAPLLTLWLGFGIGSKVAMATLIIFFPVATAFYDGLRRTEPGMLDLAATMGASRFAVLWRVRVPAALPPLEGEERLLAEVQLTLADGEQHFFFEQYARVESPYGQLSEGTDTVTLSAAQLRPLGAARLSEVRVSVRPVRLSNSQLAPQSLPSGFALEEVVSGLDQGVAFDFSADGRIFIAEKGGVVRVVENGVLRRGPFIDLSREVNAYNARGLLGFALHPNFPQQPYAYLLYTYDPRGAHPDGVCRAGQRRGAGCAPRPGNRRRGAGSQRRANGQRTHPAG